MDRTPLSSSAAGQASSGRDRTAEIFRLVLPLLSAHGSDFSPQSYALWYAYVAGNGADLRAALDEAIQARRRLTDEDTERLFASLVLAGEGRELESIRKALLKLVTGVSSAATRTRRSSEQFLLEIEDVTTRQPEPDALSVVSRLAGHARSMTDSLVSLNDRLTQSQAQIDQLREQLEHVRQESMTDPLTHLANRRAFDDALAHLIARDGSRGAPVSLVMVDVDHFKRINDEMGHVFGDRVLCLIAGVLAKNLKGKDTPARFGGEEFAVLLPGTPASAAYQVAEQLREAVAAILIRRGKDAGSSLPITVSCGVATLARGEDASAFIGRADAALYKAKRRGRNCTVQAGQ